MTPSDVEGLTQSVTDLGGKIDGFTKEVQNLRKYGERSRALIWRQWVLGLLVLLLVVVVAVVAVGARHTAATVQRNAENAYSACVRANEARKTTTDLWNNIFSFPPTRPLSPQEQAAVNANVAVLRARIAKDYAQQDCSKLK